jgi:hypothetical protein
MSRMPCDAVAVVILSGNPVDFQARPATFLPTHGFAPAWFLLRDFGASFWGTTCATPWTGTAPL